MIKRFKFSLRKNARCENIPICHRKTAFTLAEVIITLGIIGVVAALTIPALIANHRKKVVTTRMEKFYSVMNQASRMSIVEHSEEGFTSGYESITLLSTTSQEIMDWYNEYYSKYLNTLKLVKISDGIKGALSDGSGFVMIYAGHTTFCPVYEKCETALKNAGNSGLRLYTGGMDGKNTFGFILRGNGSFKTYDVCWDGTREGAVKLDSPSCPYGDGPKYGCADLHKLCSKLIEIDGWEIKDDYPIRF